MRGQVRQSVRGPRERCPADRHPARDGDGHSHGDTDSRGHRDPRRRSPATAPAPHDPAAAKALAVQACETIADGFAADRVATAAPLAAQAAGADGVWQPLATDLEFIRTHPIDPQTGVGPQKTVDSSTAAAHDCFTLAGVTVSQD
ncbi:hypothetical protein A0130_16390 [Leifsonia xyli]|uniref:hypothetical protein n=1 Tax=Leifsonia xyli TaxID=1575 RepID=UPI0007CDE485|nr:hypothetical protein A0130_16390 [Leifsonia xyli]